LRRKRYTASRLHNVGRQTSRRGEKLRLGRSKRIAERLRRLPGQVLEAEAEASGHAVLRHPPQGTIPA